MLRLGKPTRFHVIDWSRTKIASDSQGGLSNGTGGKNCPRPDCVDQKDMVPPEKVAVCSLGAKKLFVEGNFVVSAFVCTTMPFLNASHGPLPPLVSVSGRPQL